MSQRRRSAPPVPREDPPGASVPGAVAAPPSLRLLGLGAGLAALVFAVFSGLARAGFVNFDDPRYVTENAHVLKGLSWGNLAWAFQTTSFSNWHPLTWLSHMVDVQLFGMDAGAHHVVSVALHAANAVLLLLLLARMTGSLWRSAFAAALFAFHPLHVESVAWVAERKDVLSTLFGLLALLAWLGFIRSRRPAGYLLALLLFALGLMAKPMLVTLPFALLLLDVWPLRRTGLFREGEAAVPRGLFLEKTPFFLLSAASCTVTLLAQRGGGSVQSLEGIGGLERLADAAWAYGAYLFQTVWPAGLSVFYPLPRQGHPAGQVILATLALGVATAWAFRSLRSRPYLLFGWLWFLGTLVPVIGLVQIGSQARADRYTYLPLIGLFVAVAWGAGALAEKNRTARFLTVAACGALLLALLAVTRVQVSYWSDSATLFERALSVTSDSWLAHNNLGAVLFDRGQREEAVAHFSEALRIKPDYVDAHVNLGVALDKMGRHPEAVEQYRLAAECGSKSAVVLVKWGDALAAGGDLAAAIHPYREALEIAPDSVDAWRGLGLALAEQGTYGEAADSFRRALLLAPEDGEVHRQLGRALAGQKQWDEAVCQYEAAVRLQPDLAAAYNDWGVALAGQGRLKESAQKYGEALKLRPAYAEACNNLGLVMAAQGHLPEAILRFRQALDLDPSSAGAHNNLGVALARAGRREEAVEEFRRALRLRPDFDRARVNLQNMGGALPESRP